MIVSTAIHVHALGKYGEIKTVLGLLSNPELTEESRSGKESLVRVVRIAICKYRKVKNA